MAGKKIRIGVISAYPKEDWDAQQIFAAAAARSEAELLSPLDFAADLSLKRCVVLIRGRSCGRFDAILTPRALGDEGEPDLQLELYRTLAEEGMLMVNPVDALLRALDKFKTSWLLAQAGLPTPRAIVTQRLPEAARALAALGGQAVAKPLFGSLGIGVERVTSEEQLAVCLARWQALYLQEFIEGDGYDLRIFVIGQRVAAAVHRIAPPDEFRTNLHLGGRAVLASPAPAAARLAVAAAMQLGLDYAGVDLMEAARGPMVIEVNGTPRFEGIYQATGQNMAWSIIEHVLARIAQIGARGGPIAVAVDRSKGKPRMSGGHRNRSP